MAKVLITEYLGQQVVAGARSLAKAGDEVVLGTWTRGPRIDKYRTRSIHEVQPLDPPNANPSVFGESVAALAEEVGADVVMPFGLQSYWALSSHVSHVAPLPVMVAPLALFEHLNNKRTAAELINELGIESPKNFPVRIDSDLPAVVDEARFPVVVKVAEGSGVAAGLRYANDGEELRAAWVELRDATETNHPGGEPPVVQEFVPGYVHDACTLTVHGEPVRIVTQIRRLMYPIYGGVGAINVTTHDAELANIARIILEATRWHGPAQIEFKKDSRDGKYKFIEFNTKLWGTLDLSVKAGVDFPGMIRDHLLGRTLQRGGEYPEGLRYSFWFPLAVLAYRQLWREYGFRAFRPLARCKRRVNAFELGDLKPTLFDIMNTYKRLRAGRLVEVNANLPRELINGPETWSASKAHHVVSPSSGYRN